MKINVTVKGTIPPKYFHKKAIVEFIPVLKYNGGQTELKKYVITGEKVKEPKGDITITKKSGGSFTYTDVIVYKPEMNKSELVVNPVAKLKKKTTNLDKKGDFKLGDGVIYTATRVGKDEDLSIADHGYEKETFVTKSGNIYYAYNDAKINMKLDQNKKPENVTKLKDLNDFINLGLKVKTININAWASPEGEETLNQKLTDNRSKSADKWLKDIYDAIAKEYAKVNKLKNYKATYPVINLLAKGEDWDGFQKELNASNLKDKNTILNVIKSQNDKFKREKTIRDMAVIYKEIEDNILTLLRRSEIVYVCYENKKTDEKIAELSTTDPGKLDVKELLYAGTLTNDLDTKLKIYKNVTTTYPGEWKGFNNLAWAYLMKKDYSNALVALEKASVLSPNNGLVLNNLGVATSWKGDWAGAMNYFKQAESKGVKTTYNQGILLIRQGDYAGAITNFTGKTCRYNIGLAQVLNKTYPDATSTLECGPKTAETYYLLAIIGARTNNTSMMYDYLKKACQLDAKYKAQAKDDREFLKFSTSGDFTNAIQ
jgi:tetratricopeptide (TPR) repeat protein